MSKPFESYSILSLIGKNQGRCGYCDKENTSYTYGVWAHTMTCQVWTLFIQTRYTKELLSTVYYSIECC
ncbi:hypothetical protein BDF14DRAFT_1756002 [Spinellus fusiger]|nr:hypothetical protein BDF14DRAFT_1756002 [Spinellus fusiger]